METKQTINSNHIPPISNSSFSAVMHELDGYNKWILDYHHQYLASPLLEIGLGHGAFYGYLPKHIHDYVGLDIDNALIQHAKRTYPKNQYLCKDLASDDFVSTLNDKKFNSILCFNVLEHIEDHETALKNMLDVLTSQGHILLFVPAFNALYTDLDQLAGHHRRYKISDLINLADKCGGQIVKWSYFNFLGGLGWWANKFLTHKSLNDTSVNWQITVFSKYFLPISKLIQPITQKVFGQSLYVVIKRKGL